MTDARTAAASMHCNDTPQVTQRLLDAVKRRLAYVGNPPTADPQAIAEALMQLQPRTDAVH
jgi:hypothetical protein